jgi:hypothetical protein
MFSLKINRQKQSLADLEEKTCELTVIEEAVLVG